MNKNSEDNEIISEDLDDSVVSEEHAGDALKKLKEKLKEAEAKARGYLDSWQRAQADFINAKKRDDEAKAEFLKFANSDFIYQLIPVLDSFELSLPHPSTNSGQAAAGLEAIYRQLLAILKSNGLEEVNPMGELFDPRKHESLGSIETKEKSDDHKILEVVQKGYILSGKIIRPAKVKIASYNG